MPESPQRWLLVKNTFQAARERPPNERRAFLDKSCATDPALRAEVEQLLKDHEQARDFLSQPATGFEQTAEVPAGERFGPYVISQTLARGGMGTVYLAVRDDDAFKKVVALKLIREGPYDDIAERRFRQERQILAHLQHPNIASILDGGTSDKGPYLVMEYVAGKPIHEYCRENELSLRERVSLFRQVCSAVHFAHQNLVIHRDIKPTNILVTADGAPKLLDFGIAKLVEAPGSAAEAAPTKWLSSPSLDADGTQTALGVMTPAYASPEQFHQEALTTSTDIYSLGVVLYELATGTLPFELGAKTEDWPRQVRETPPTPPSERADSPVPSLVSDIDVDLDSVLLKALSKDPADRYSSVEQLSHDLERYLRGRPVAAYPSTPVYRLRKFVGRNAVATALASIAAVLLAASSFVSFALYRQSEEERVRAIDAQRNAEEQARTADEVAEFVIGLFEVSDPNESRGETLTTRELLDQGATRIEHELADQPLVRARLMETLGRVHSNLGLYQEAEALLEGSLTLRREQLGEQHREVAEGLHATASLHLAVARPHEALEALERALAIREELFGSRSVEVASTLSNISFARNAIGDSSAARTAAEQAVAIFEATDTSVREYALALNNLARALQTTGELAAAVPIMERVHALVEQSRPEGHPDISRSLTNLGAAYYRVGDYRRAQGVFERALESMEIALGPDHPNVGVLVNNIALLAKKNGELERAKALYERSIAIHERTVGEPNADLAATLVNVGNLHRELGELDVAIRELTRAVRIVEDKGGPLSLLATSLQHLANAVAESDNPGSARALLERSLMISTRNSGPDNVAHATVLVSLARLDRRAGHIDESLSRLARAFSLIDGPLSESDVTRIECLAEWAFSLVASGEIEASEEKLRDASAAYASGFGDEHAARYFDEARYWALRGELTRANDLASRSRELGIPWQKLSSSAELSVLRDDPRFEPWAGTPPAASPR